MEKIPENELIAAGMHDLSNFLLGKAIYDVTFSEMCRPFVNHLAIIHAVHGAEILIKGKLVAIDPAIIFERKDVEAYYTKGKDLSKLIDKGRTEPYSRLPNLLYRHIKYKIPDKNFFLEMGIKRNRIIHMGLREEDPCKLVLEYLFHVVDPIAWDLWNESFVTYSGEYDDVIIAEGYLQEQLLNYKIQVHPKTAKLLLQDKE